MGLYVTDLWLRRGISYQLDGAAPWMFCPRSTLQGMHILSLHFQPLTAHTQPYTTTTHTTSTHRVTVTHKM